MGLILSDDYGPNLGHPADPRNGKDTEGLMSLQPLGDANVMVEFDLGACNLPTVVGAWIAGEFVDEIEFSQRRLELWRAAIGRELESERASFELDQQELAL